MDGHHLGLSYQFSTVGTLLATTTFIKPPT
jgi:hypothetical protein